MTSSHIVDPHITDHRVKADHIAFDWSDGCTSHMHHFWLRDNCRCNECLHWSTRERLQDVMSLDLDIRPAEVGFDATGRLTLTWPDGHRSDFSTAWLRTHAYDDWARAERVFQEHYWGPELLEELPDVQYDAVMDPDCDGPGRGGLHDWLFQLRTYGMSIVRNTRDRELEVTRVAKRIAFLRETNFGAHFIVESKPNPENVAYTAGELKAHSDLADIEIPPGIQFLHCRTFDATGGESLLVDGFRAARILKERDPAAFDILTTTPVGYRYHDEDWDLRWKGEVVRLGVAAEFAEVRYSNQLLHPFDLPPDRVREFYRAYQAFTEILRSPEVEIRFKLNPGDIMCFNNRRVLHGRSAFDPNSGPRRLEGCYVDLDEAWSKLRKLNPEQTLDQLAEEAA